MRTYFVRSIAGCVVSLTLACGPALAMTTYQYAGTPYRAFIDSTPPEGAYDNTMRVQGEFSVTTPLTAMILTDITSDVVAFSFFDGRNVLTETTADFWGFFAAVDANGQIVEWNVGVSSGPFGSGLALGEQFISIATVGTDSSFDEARLYECTEVDSEGCSVSLQDAAGTITVGTWSVVPIPPAAWLFGSALGLLGWMRRKAT